MHWILPLIMFMFSISGFVGAVLWTNKYVYPHINNQKECDTKSVQVYVQNKENCAVWDDKSNTCRIGNINGDNCESKGHVGPLIIAIVAVLLLVGSFITGYMAFQDRNKSL